MSITGRLRRIREAAGITQAELAARAGIAPANLSVIESGRVDVRMSTLARILDALDLEVELVPRGRSTTLETALARAERGRGRLAAAGLGPSDPSARLIDKERRGVDVTVERELLDRRG